MLRPSFLLSIVLVLLVAPIASAQYTDGTPLYLDPGANTVTITNTGTQGGTKTLTLDKVDSSHQNLVWFSMPGFPQQVGAQTACHAPCGVSLNLEYGKYKYWSQIYNSSVGVPTTSSSPISAKSYLPFVINACPGNSLGSYQIPIPVMGFEDMACSVQFSVSGGTSVSNLRVLIHTSNLRNGQGWVQINGGPRHYLSVTPVDGMTSNGSACTGTTPFPHGMSAGNVIQLNGTFSGIMNQSAPYVDALNHDASYMYGYNTLSSVTATTFTFPCTSPAGTLQPIGTNQGLTVSATTYAVDEARWFGGLENNREAIWLAVPLGSSEVVAGATNTIVFGFSGDTTAVVHGWRVLSWNIVQPAALLTQIVVSGSTATATCSSSTNCPASGTAVILDAPGPAWRFNDKRVTTTVDATHFSFPWGSDIPGETAGSAPYTTAAGTYTVPTVNSTYTGWVFPPAMYAAQAIVPAADFTYQNPSTFSYGSGSASLGLTAFTTGTLKDRNPWAPNNTSLVHCVSCHAPAVGTAPAGWDLPYFGFEPQTIYVASRGRGLTDAQAQNILAYIGSIASGVTVPAQGHGPWDPLNQPCPGLDAGSAVNWARGCGLEWVLTHDENMGEWLVPGGSYAGWLEGANVNPRELPVPIQLPSWLKLLPDIHPIDFWHDTGLGDFTATTVWTKYQSYLSTQVQGDLTTYTSNNYFGDLSNFVVQNTQLPALASIESGPGATGTDGGYQSPGQYGTAYYDVAKWANIQSFDLCFGAGLQNLLNSATNAFEGTTPNARAGSQYSRGCQSDLPFNTGPHRALGGSQFYLFNENRAQAVYNWNHETEVNYHWQLILNAGDKLAQGNAPIDWPYQCNFYEQPARLRPGVFLNQLCEIKQGQEFWGWNNTVTSVGPALSASPTYVIPGSETAPAAMFTSNTELAAIATAQAQEAETAVGVSGSSTSDFQTWLSNGHCNLSLSPNALQGFLDDSCMLDQLAFALAYWNTQGVSTTITNPIVTFANSITMSPHDFAFDQSSTCSLNSGPAFNWVCTNFPSLVTFTNGSPSIAATNTFSAGQVVNFITNGALPTGLSTNTNYYVISTGLSSTHFEVSATMGGSAITAGSAGSGTSTVNPG